MKRKRIAIITPYGAEPRLDNYAEFVLAQSLIAAAYPVRFFTYAVRGVPGYEEDLVYKTVPVTRCRQRFGFSPRLFFSLLTYRPDVVMCFHPRSFLNFTAYGAARLIGARVVVEIVGILHDPFIVRDVDNPADNVIEPPALMTRFPHMLAGLLRRTPRAWENYIFHMPTAHADTIIAINDEEQRFVKKIYGRDSARIYWCTPQPPEERAKPAGTLPAHFLFFIGQIKRRKGWDLAIDALAQLRERGIEEHLVFVSPQRDVSKPIAYAQSRRVEEQITFLTAVTNAEKYWLYEHCDAVLVPSRYEGFGLPVFEAFVAHKPVIASDIPVFLEFLRDGENALLAAGDDPDSLARAIERLHDEALRQTLIAGGDRTAAEFSAPRMVEAYRAHIDR